MYGISLINVFVQFTHLTIVIKIGQYFSLLSFMPRTYTISPDIFLVVVNDEEGNSYRCNHLDIVELDGYSVHVSGIYDWIYATTNAVIPPNAQI